jgi:hypothetical protein
LADLPAGAALQPLQPGAAALLHADANGRAHVALAAQSFAVWRVQSSAARP